ncbi:MAG: HEAT repeat domain-containing protein [Dehalococcoidales bacterium]|nr:HEAT repeat domain-containing protein [Dehalococcoidales bacterium]
MLSSFKEIITDMVENSRPLLNSELICLSNISPEESELFTTIQLKRRREIIYRLVELSKDNIELNFDKIFKRCLSDEDACLRNKAIEGLWENEEASLVNPLANLLENDSSEKVQAAAATALGIFALLAEYNKLRSCYISRVYQVLLTTVDDKKKSINIRRCTLEAIAPLNCPEVQNVIKETYKGQNSKLRISSIRAMGKNCDQLWLPILLKELSSTDVKIRYEAAWACGELGEDKAVPKLINLTYDSDISVQLAAIHALGKTGGNIAKEYLEQYLNYPSETISMAAEQALQELEAWGDPFSFQS